MTAVNPSSPREIELLDPDLWEAPRRLSQADCSAHMGGEGRRETRNIEDKIEETER